MVCWAPGSLKKSRIKKKNEKIAIDFIKTIEKPNQQKCQFWPLWFLRQFWLKMAQSSIFSFLKAYLDSIKSQQRCLNAENPYKKRLIYYHPCLNSEYDNLIRRFLLLDPRRSFVLKVACCQFCTCWSALLITMSTIKKQKTLPKHH